MKWKHDAKGECNNANAYKKLTLKVSNEMKCPSDKYKRQFLYTQTLREVWWEAGGKGGWGETSGNTPVTCRPNKIEIFKTFPAPTRSLWELCLLWVLAHLLATQMDVGCECVWVWAWQGRGRALNWHGMTWRDFKFSNKQAKQLQGRRRRRRLRLRRIFKNV